MLALASGLAATARSADAPLQFNQIELTDGRVLRSVVVKSYDAEGDRILVIADRHAQFIPLRLIANPIAQRLRDTAPRTGQNLSVVAPTVVATPEAGTTAGTAAPAATGPTPTPVATTTAASIAARRQAAATGTPTPTPTAATPPTLPAK